MKNFLIFLPEFEYANWRGSLYGVVFHCQSGTAVYVLGNQCGNKCEYSMLYEVVGSIQSKSKACRPENWISITLRNRQIERITVTSENLYNVTVVLYNKAHFRRSQLLEPVRFQPNDFVYHLIQEVKEEPVKCCSRQVIIEPRSHYIISSLLMSLQYVLPIAKKIWVAPIFQISSFGLHMLNTLETFALLLNRVIDENRFSVQFVNFVAARILDTILGQVIIFYLISYMSLDEIFFGFMKFQESIVINLESMVEWLMGSPAGFKLNRPLNNILGPFYQFHISLWGTFLKLSNPFLRTIFDFFLLWGSLGLSFQVAILTDLLAIVSVHMYCIYVYASRLYYFQMKGLKILSRLFIGRKRNPLPGKQSSPPYTTEQLLFGTVSFTILLFLLPTTLIYYSVFTMIRIVLIFVGGILIRLRHFMNIFPAYITWLWLFDYVPLTSTLRLTTNTNHFPDGTLVTKIEPVCSSLLETVVMCIPESILRPENIEWKKLTSHVLVGNLIYRV